MLQQDKPDDYIIGTGESHSVRGFVELAFEYAGIEIEWKGNWVNKKGVTCSLASHLISTLKVGDILIEINSHYFCPTEVAYLLADPSKARDKMGWKPRITLKELVRIMVDFDIESIGISSTGEGKKIILDKRLHWIKNQYEGK
jgi:GDPmannose 4,6-dehydratase